MIEHVVFIFIISLLIGGMLWSDRDSRYYKDMCYECDSMHWVERYEPIIRIEGYPTPTRFTQFMIDAFAQNFDFNLSPADDFSCAAMFNIDISKDEIIKLPDVTYPETEATEKSASWDMSKADPIKDIQDYADKFGPIKHRYYHPLPSESEEQ